MAGPVASPELPAPCATTQLRINSVWPPEAGSGHPSSCASAADIVAALFFHHALRSSNRKRSTAIASSSQKDMRLHYSMPRGLKPDSFQQAIS